MYFNSANSIKSLDPRRSADYGWEIDSLEPQIGKSSGKLFKSVPPMIASFDLETTGFITPEPISFGLAIFRDGKLSERESQHFLIDPDKMIEEGAFETHGWTNHDLAVHRSGGKPATGIKEFDEETIPVGGLQYLREKFDKDPGNRGKTLEDRYDITPVLGPNAKTHVKIKRKQIAPPITQEDVDLHPALPLGIGINKVVGIMSNLQKQGFVFLGANPTYDTRIIKSIWERENDGMPVEVSGFNPESMRLVDVIKHDHSIESKEANTRSRSLSALSQHYGIEAGGHRALHDSIAAGRVFIEGQVPLVQKMLEESGDQSNKIKLSAVEASALGIDWQTGGPCWGPGCGFCSHLTEVAMSHTDPGKAGKVNSIMKMHQGM